MALKDLFTRKPARGGRRTRVPKKSIQDLMLEERYDEAGEALSQRLEKHPGDTAALRKLADLYAQTGRVDDAVAEYRRASDLMARDGFFDRAIATLAKAAKVSPGSAEIATRIEELRAAKTADHKGSEALGGLRGQERGDATKWIQLQQHWRRIQAQDFARMLDEDQIPRLFEALEIVRVPADAPIARQGDADEVLYIIAAGEVRVSCRVGKSLKPTTLRTYSKGGIVGDRALFEKGTWPASYDAATDAVLLKLSRAGLETALQGNPDPRQLLNALRNQRHDEQVADLVRKIEAG